MVFVFVDVFGGAFWSLGAGSSIVVGSLSGVSATERMLDHHWTTTERSLQFRRNPPPPFTGYPPSSSAPHSDPEDSEAAADILCLHCLTKDSQKV